MNKKLLLFSCVVLAYFNAISANKIKFENDIKDKTGKVVAGSEIRVFWMSSVVPVYNQTINAFTDPKDGVLLSSASINGANFEFDPVPDATVAFVFSAKVSGYDLPVDSGVITFDDDKTYKLELDPGRKTAEGKKMSPFIKVEKQP